MSEISVSFRGVVGQNTARKSTGPQVKSDIVLSLAESEYLQGRQGIGANELIPFSRVVDGKRGQRSEQDLSRLVPYMVAPGLLAVGSIVRNRYEDPTLRSQKRCGRRLVAD